MTYSHLLCMPLRSAPGSFRAMQCLLARVIQPTRLAARVPRETRAIVPATPLSLTGAGNPISPQASPRERGSSHRFHAPFRTKVSPDARLKDCQYASTTTLRMGAHVQVTARAVLMCASNVSVATPSSIAPAAELQARTLAFRHHPLISGHFRPPNFHCLTGYHFQHSSVWKCFPELVAYPELLQLTDFNALQWTICERQVSTHGFLIFAIRNIRICSYPHCANVFPILFGLHHLAALRPKPDPSLLTLPQVYHSLALFDPRLGRTDCHPCTRQRPSESKMPMHYTSWWATPYDCAVTTSLSWNNLSTV